MRERRWSKSAKKCSELDGHAVHEDERGEREVEAGVHAQDARGSRLGDARTVSDSFIFFWKTYPNLISYCMSRK